MLQEQTYYTRQWIRKRSRKWLSRYFYSRLFRDNDPNLAKSIMVAGAGRSGTTWLANIISSQLPSRIMFEPFHPILVQDYAKFNYFQYMRPEDPGVELQAYCSRVFSGVIRHPWIDRTVSTLTPQIRIVKEIRANLLLKWISEYFPEVPLLFIIRHPCAVVQSRLQLEWATDSDIEPFLAQPNLIADHLSDKLDIIMSARSPEQKHAVIWCISNLIPMRQFGTHNPSVVFYEDLCVRPEEVLPRVFSIVRQPYDKAVLDLLNRPSSTATRRSAVMYGRDRVTQWQSQLSPREVEEILSVVRAFGLEHLYADSSLPISGAVPHYCSKG